MLLSLCALALGASTLQLNGENSAIMFSSPASEAILTASCAGDRQPTSTVILMGDALPPFQATDSPGQTLSVGLGNVRPSCAGVADLQLTPCVAQKTGYAPLWYCVFANDADGSEKVEGPLHAYREMDTLDGHALAVATWLNCSLPLARGNYTVAVRHWAPTVSRGAAELQFKGAPGSNRLEIVPNAPPSPPQPVAPPGGASRTSELARASVECVILTRDGCR